MCARTAAAAPRAPRILSPPSSPRVSIAESLRKLRAGTIITLAHGCIIARIERRLVPLIAQHGEMIFSSATLARAKQPLFHRYTTSLSLSRCMSLTEYNYLTVILERSFTGTPALIDIPADSLYRIARNPAPTLLITISRVFSLEIGTRAWARDNGTRTDT